MLFLDEVFEDDNGVYPTIGEILRRSKNNGGVPQDENNRKFVLLGDPALTLNYPKHNVNTLSINGQNPEEETIEVKALEEVTITGEITNQAGTRLNDFNGILVPTVYDKMLELKTLGQDERSYEASFLQQKSVVFKGQVSIVNGLFEFSFIVPKDISLQLDRGKIQYYAFNESTDAFGYDDRLMIGGISENEITDDSGPEIEIFMNDENFVYGGLTNSDPILIVKIKDESGINTVGTGIGHDIVADLDQNANDPIILNEYYKAALDDFTSGNVNYQLLDLEPGLHQIEVKAFDVLNNSGTGYTEFLVSESAEMALDHVLNYPNPFIDKTNFWFEHNQAFQDLKVQVQIFTINGRLIKSIHKNVYATGNSIRDIEWNGLDEYGNKIGKGVYVYQLTVSNGKGQSSSEIQKLVLLK